MINLTQEDKQKLSAENYYENTVLHRKLASGLYYVKYCREDEIFRELIGKEVFDIVGIKCPQYYFNKENNCLLSEDLKSKKGFIYMSEIPDIQKDLFWRRITLDIVINSICKEVNNQEEIILELNIMHFIDILFSNIDRHLNNYGIIIDEMKNGHITVFDNAMFLDNLDCVTKPMACKSVTTRFPKYEECQKFLKTLSEEHLEYIYEIFLKFKPKTLKLIIKKIEKDNDYKFYYTNKTLRLYTKNYIMIHMIIQKIIKEKAKNKMLIKR